MYTFIYLTTEIIIFCILLIGFSIILKNINLWKYIIFSITIPIDIYLLAEGFNKTHQVLRARGYHIELGHSSLIDVVLWFVFMISAIIIILYWGVKKIRKN